LNWIFFAMRIESTSVAFTGCRQYDADMLATSIDQVLSAVTDLPELHSCHVLLKPNLISAKYGSLPCTEPAFMVAAARWFVEQGANVSIGDSPAFGTAEAALTQLGVAGKLAALGVVVTNFSEVRKVPLVGGDTAGIAAAALDCDLLVNLPRVKAHAQTGVTLAVKNCFGCLAGLRKPLWHMAYGGEHGSFCSRLVQLLAVLADSLTLVDGITAMHVTGPLHGKPYALGVVAASTNPVAVDRALLELLGIAPHLSPLMTACVEAGLPGSQLESLLFPLFQPEELAVVDFIIPETLAPIRFDILRFVTNMMRRALRAV
jgi:uncharacterized protein (DUF362 family)